MEPNAIAGCIVALIFVYVIFKLYKKASEEEKKSPKIDIKQLIWRLDNDIRDPDVIVKLFLKEKGLFEYDDQVDCPPMKEGQIERHLSFYVGTNRTRYNFLSKNFLSENKKWVHIEQPK